MIGPHPPLVGNFLWQVFSFNDSNCLDTSNVMLFSHASIDAVFCRVKSWVADSDPRNQDVTSALAFAPICLGEISRENGLKEVWLAVDLPELEKHGAKISAHQKRSTQNKTGQTTRRHLTSRFGCGGRI